MLRMNSALNRVYSLFYMGLTAVCVTAGIGALSAFLYRLDGRVSFDVHEVTHFGRSKRGFEEAHMVFDIDCDLSNIVYMNTRLFYAYILAEWTDAKEGKHSSILWNELIKKEDPVFKGISPCNFTFRQVGQPMRGQTVNLTFTIQQVPYVGFFRTHALLQKQFTLPQQYTVGK